MLTEMKEAFCVSVISVNEILGNHKCDFIPTYIGNFRPDVFVFSVLVERALLPSTNSTFIAAILISWRIPTMFQALQTGQLCVCVCRLIESTVADRSIDVFCRSTHIQTHTQAYKHISITTTNIPTTWWQQWQHGGNSILVSNTLLYTQVRDGKIMMSTRYVNKVGQWLPRPPVDSDHSEECIPIKLQTSMAWCCSSCVIRFACKHLSFLCCMMHDSVMSFQ